MVSLRYPDSAIGCSRDFCNHLTNRVWGVKHFTQLFDEPAITSIRQLFGNDDSRGQTRELGPKKRRFRSAREPYVPIAGQHHNRLAVKKR